MKHASCIAVLEDIIEALETMPEKGEPVAMMADKPIYVIGLFTGKGNSGYFGKAEAIRWSTCPKDTARGFFERGLACYMSKLPAWASSLPKSK